MNWIAKPAMVLGLVGVLAVASMTASEARDGRWMAAGIGLAAGALIGAAAANAGNYNYGSGYGYDSTYGRGYGYGPGDAYDAERAYAYQPTARYIGPTYRHRAPGYATDPAFAYTGDPAYAYGRGFGYHSNAVGPWQERRLLGADY